MGTHPIFESDFDCLTEMSVFRPANGFQNNCAVCNAILRIYLNLKRDIICFACHREFTAPQRPRNDDSGRSSPTDFMPEPVQHQQQQQQQQEQPAYSLPADFVVHCSNEWCSFRVRVINGDTSAYKRHAANCAEQYALGKRYKSGLGEKLLFLFIYFFHIKKILLFSRSTFC